MKRFRVGWYTLADLRGAPGTPPGVQILSFSCSFRQKNLQNNPNLGIGAPPLGKILDPPQVHVTIYRN